MSALGITAMGIDGADDLTRTIEAARKGDLGAFESLVRQYERLVLATALRMLGNLPDAQDVSQEVFLRLYRNLGKVEASTNLSAWLYRVTVNASHDLRKRRRPTEPVEGLVSDRDDPQNGVAEAERRRALELSLRMLPEKERAALVLRDLEGLSTEEVARVLGSSQATVRSQVAKARIKIKDFVERYFRGRV